MTVNVVKFLTHKGLNIMFILKHWNNAWLVEAQHRQGSSSCCFSICAHTHTHTPIDCFQCIIVDRYRFSKIERESVFWFLTSAQRLVRLGREAQTDFHKVVSLCRLHNVTDRLCYILMVKFTEPLQA